MNRWDIINALVTARGYKRYLEIGCAAGGTFNAVQCDVKVGVDPERGGTLRMTSDTYFAGHGDTFDIVFVDGLHHADQAERDARNALKRLSAGGCVVMHDCSPPSEAFEQPDRCGDTWKAFVSLRCDPDLDCVCHDGDYGCAVVQVGDNPDPMELPDELTWGGLVENRQKWLRLMDEDQVKRYLRI